MIYVIDANNLAGKIGVLFEDDFDKKLVGMIKEYFFDKQITVNLVFDSVDLMGDKFLDGNVNVIYTPRDSFYASADDKVVELLYDAIKNSKEEITLVTDDLEIIGKAENIIKDTHTKKLFIERASDFVVKMESRNIIKNNISDENKNGLDRKQREKIENELLDLWTKKES